MAYYARRRTTRRRTTRRPTTYRPKRRINQRRRPSKFRRTHVRIPNTIQPDYTLVRFKDRNAITFPAGTLPASAGDQSFTYTYISGNDLFDAFSLVANAPTVKPTGFEHWMNFYESFIVHKSSIKVTPISTIGTTARYLPFRMTIVPMSNLVVGNISQLTPVELAYARSKIYSGNLSNRDTGENPTAAGDPGQMVLSHTWNSMMTKKILGYKDLSDVTEVRGSVTASPDEEYHYLVYIESMIPWDGTGTATNLQLDPIVAEVEMFYKAQLLDRKGILDNPEPSV